MSPQRIQRKRTKGWRKPDNTVYVGRGTRWGNPYRVIQFRDGLGDPAARVLVPEDQKSHAFFGEPMVPNRPTGLYQASDFATKLYEQRWTPLHTEAIRTELAGKNLMCWCPLDQPCHADVLLAIANGTPN